MRERVKNAQLETRRRAGNVLLTSIFLSDQANFCSFDPVRQNVIMNLKKIG